MPVDHLDDKIGHRHDHQYDRHYTQAKAKHTLTPRKRQVLTVQDKRPRLVRVSRIRLVGHCPAPSDVSWIGPVLTEHMDNARPCPDAALPHA